MNQQEIILSIMKNSALNAYLLTSVNNQPRGRIIAPVIDGDFTLWIITFSNSQKVEDIQNNPQVAVTFNEYPNKGIREVQLFGQAQIVEEIELKERLWECKKNSIGSYFKSADDPNFTLIRIVPSTIEWSQKAQGSKQIYKV